MGCKAPDGASVFVNRAKLIGDVLSSDNSKIGLRYLQTNRSPNLRRYNLCNDLPLSIRQL